MGFQSSLGKDEGAKLLFPFIKYQNLILSLVTLSMKAIFSFPICSLKGSNSGNKSARISMVEKWVPDCRNDNGLFDFHTARDPVTAAISACLSIQCAMRPTSPPLLYFCDADITICQMLSRFFCSPLREKIERILHHRLRAKRQTALVQTSHGGSEEITVYEHFVCRNNCHKWQEI